MKILIPDNVDPVIKKIMSDMGYEVNYKPGMGIQEVSKIANEYDAILIRSYELHDAELDGEIKAIGRAGAGVNNIPIDKCAEKGIVVFNTPGANANAVKELVICGLILASRDIYHGIAWAKTLSKNVVEAVEKNKSQFKGKEIQGKKLGVIGLGATGCLVANTACHLGMKVAGYDPYINVENAWKISGSVKKAEELKSLLSDSDYLTIHVPYNEKTKRMINKEAFNNMKHGTTLLNFSRGEIIDYEALKEALEKGVIDKYVTDFPNEELLKNERVIMVPHLGASTKEAEENCAVMIAEQVNDFLRNGNIKNSVNYPEIYLEQDGKTRLGIFNKNVPGMVSQFSEILGNNKLNIHGMINKSKEDYAYNIVNIDGFVSDDVVDQISKINEVVRVRKIEK